MTTYDPSLLPDGIWSGIPMPWNEDESLNKDALRRLVTRCAGHQSHGIYVAGTSGEFHAMGEAQFGDVVETFMGTIGDFPDLGAQVGCGGFSLRQVCERASIAQANGCKVIQLNLPGWMALTDDEVLGFYKSINEKFPDLAICVYDNKSSGRDVGLDLWPRLIGAVPAIIGAKITQDDTDLPAAIYSARPDFKLLAVERNLLTMWPHGIRGVTAWISYSLPKLLGDLWSALEAGDDQGVKAGIELLDRIHAVKEPFRVLGYRAGIIDRLMGLATGFLEPIHTRVLAPWRSVDPGHVAEARAAISESLGEEFLYSED